MKVTLLFILIHRVTHKLVLFHRGALSENSILVKIYKVN